MMLTKRYEQALAYAIALHRNQVRKGTEIPYASHLLSVSALVMEYGGNEDQAIAGLLHDAAEDQGGRETLNEIHERFGEAVAQIVADCTDTFEARKPEWWDRKKDYIASLAKKDPASLLVSLADKTHNATAILHDYRRHGDALWDRFTGGKDGTIWYYQSLVEAFDALIPGPLVERLGDTVAAFAGHR